MIAVPVGALCWVARTLTQLPGVTSLSRAGALHDPCRRGEVNRRRPVSRPEPDGVARHRLDQSLNVVLAHGRWWRRRRRCCAWCWLGGIADTVGFPVLLDALCEGPHIATPSVITATTAAPIANWSSRGFTEMTRIRHSPISQVPPYRIPAEYQCHPSVTVWVGLHRRISRRGPAADRSRWLAVPRCHPGRPWPSCTCPPLIACESAVACLLYLVLSLTVTAVCVVLPLGVGARDVDGVTRDRSYRALHPRPLPRVPWPAGICRPRRGGHARMPR